MKYSYIIWDWNGTLLDDVETNLRTANRMLARRNLPVIGNTDRYREMFSFPVIDFYRKAGFDLTEEEFRSAAEEYVETYREYSSASRLFPDAAATLEAFGKAGLCQVILSATEQTRLREEVASYGVAPCFAEILGVGDNLGTSKADRARAFTKTLGGRALFIGDTAHDAAVAKECSCDCVLVSRGHMDKSRLEETGCEVFENLAVLSKKILQNEQPETKKF